MAEVICDPEVAKWNARAFRSRWRAGMFIEINDYQGRRSSWKRRRLILIKKVSRDIWSAIELTRVNSLGMTEGKLPEPIQITLEYMMTPGISFVCDQLPCDLGE